MRAIACTLPLQCPTMIVCGDRDPIIRSSTGTQRMTPSLTAASRSSKEHHFHVETPIVLVEVRSRLHRNDGAVRRRPRTVQEALLGA